jgi:hypothetical protein
MGASLKLNYLSTQLRNNQHGSVSFLKEDPDWVITFRGEGYHLGVRSSDETSGGNPLEFNGLHRVGGDPGYSCIT